MEPFMKALLHEIELQKEYLTSPIETIYFGGGTPSLLSLKDLDSIINQIRLHFKLSNEKNSLRSQSR